MKHGVHDMSPKLTSLQVTEAKRIRRLKVIYYIDETIVLCATVVGVVSADALLKRLKGEKVTKQDVFTDGLNLAFSALLAVAYYGKVYTKLKYSDATKPPLIQRLANAIFSGIAMRTTTTMLN